MGNVDYQLIIIGGGPAGLSAGLYAARGRVDTLLLEKGGACGGQVLMTDWVDNYPGFTDGISGFDLMEKMTAQCDRFELARKTATVQSLELEGPVKTIYLENGEKLTCRTVIITTGAGPRRLGVAGEEELTGRGVSYCATCDAPFYRNLEVAVVGGGNTAVEEALHLTKFASKVTIIHRRDELRATKILQEKAFKNEKMAFAWNAQVKSIEGGQAGVETVQLVHNDDTESSLSVQGIFILIGVKPNNALLTVGQVDTDEQGFIITSDEMETNVPGVFAAGDIRYKSFRQIINAAGEGAVAELAAEHYLSGLE